MQKIDALSTEGLVLAVFADWAGYTIDNAVIISETLAERPEFVSLIAQRFRCRGEITRLMPTFPKKSLLHLDKNGLAGIGGDVAFGDILIGRVIPKKSTGLTEEEKLLLGIFGEKARPVKDAPCRMPFQDKGMVIDAKYFPATAQQDAEGRVDVLIKRELRIGDLLYWPRAKKTFVVAAILPKEQMPLITKLSRKAEIVINPHVADEVTEIRFNRMKIIMPGNGNIRRETGELILRKSSVRLEEKIQARSTGAYHLVSSQPLENPNEWVQGAMIKPRDLAWLMGAGCGNIVRELLTFKSSSREAYEVYSCLVLGQKIKFSSSAPSTILKVLIKSLQGLAIYAAIADTDLQVRFALDDDIRSWSYGEVFHAVTLNFATGKPVPKGLFCQTIFGPIEDYSCACGKFKRVRYKDVICHKCNTEVAKASVRRERMGHIALYAPVTHPLNGNISLRLLPVLPPDLRPMIPREGKFLVDDLNDLYRAVISRNHRLGKLMEMKAPEPIIRNEQRMLQDTVNRLFGVPDSRDLHTLLGFSQESFNALFRKRVDYSGEAIVIPNSDIDDIQCGLPVTMALEIFKPILIRELVQRAWAHNIRSAARMIDSLASEAVTALQTIIGQRLVIAGTESCYAGFLPVLVDGEAAQLNPTALASLKISADGGKIAVHLPISREAQIDAQNIMLAHDFDCQSPSLQSAFLFGLNTLSGFLFSIRPEGETLPLSIIDKILLGDA